MIRPTLLIGLFLTCGLARAQTDDRAAQARTHYEQGMARFQLEEWDQAISEWQDGFRIKPVPQFLYNIAQAYRLSKRPEKALSFYKKYLNMEPKAENRAEVERHIKALQKLVDEQAKTATQPPTQPMEAGHPSEHPAKPVEPPAPAPAPAPATPAPAPAAAPAPEPTPAPVAVVEKTPPKKTPITRKGWFWGVIGGVAAVVVAGVIVGVVLSGDSTKTLPAVKF